MMKYVFVLVLLIVGGIAGVQGTAIVYRWTHDMIVTQGVRPGEMNFAMAPGSLPRTGGQLYSLQGAARGRGPAQEPGAGDFRVDPQGRQPLRGLLHAVPRAGRQRRRAGGHQVRGAHGLSNADLQKGRTDGYWPELPVGGRSGDAVLRGVTVRRRAVGCGELPPHSGREMSAATMDAPGVNGRNGLLWGLAVAGVIAFIWGALSADPRATGASISSTSSSGPASPSRGPRWPA